LSSGEALSIEALDPPAVPTAGVKGALPGIPYGYARPGDDALLLWLLAGPKLTDPDVKPDCWRDGAGSGVPSFALSMDREPPDACSIGCRKGLGAGAEAGPQADGVMYCLGELLVVKRCS